MELLADFMQIDVRGEEWKCDRYNHGFVRLDQVKTNVLFSVILL